jgi:lysosomal alpha-mannosidase
MQYINEHNHANLKLKMSTPSEFVEALKQEKITWPVRYEDALPYGEQENDYWSGYFSSRPGSKKLVKDTSALMSAESKLFSEQVIKKESSDEDVKNVLESQKNMLE